MKGTSPSKGSRNHLDFNDRARTVNGKSLALDPITNVEDSSTVRGTKQRRRRASSLPASKRQCMATSIGKDSQIGTSHSPARLEQASQSSLSCKPADKDTHGSFKSCFKTQSPPEQLQLTKKKLQFAEDLCHIQTFYQSMYQMVEKLQSIRQVEAQRNSNREARRKESLQEKALYKFYNDFHDHADRRKEYRNKIVGPNIGKKTTRKKLPLCWRLTPPSSKDQGNNKTIAKEENLDQQTGRVPLAVVGGTTGSKAASELPQIHGLGGSASGQTKDKDKEDVKENCESQLGMAVDDEHGSGKGASELPITLASFGRACDSHKDKEAAVFESTFQIEERQENKRFDVSGNNGVACERSKHLETIPRATLQDVLDKHTDDPCRALTVFRPLPPILKLSIGDGCSIYLRLLSGARVDGVTVVRAVTSGSCAPNYRLLPDLRLLRKDDVMVESTSVCLKRRLRLDVVRQARHVLLVESSFEVALLHRRRLFAGLQASQGATAMILAKPLAQGLGRVDGEWRSVAVWYKNAHQLAAFLLAVRLFVTGMHDGEVNATTLDRRAS